MDKKKAQQDLIDMGVTKLGLPLGTRAYEALVPIVEDLEEEGLRDGDIESFLIRIVKAVVYRNPQAALERYMAAKAKEKPAPVDPRRKTKKTSGV